MALVLLDSKKTGSGPGTALSPFERDIGAEHGRLPSSAAPDGSYVFELGHAGLEEGSFEIGDFFELRQTGITFDAQASLVRVQVNVTLPETLPSSPAVEWEFTARLNGSARYTRRLRAEPRTLTLTDIAVPTVAAGGGDALAFRLELVSA